MNIKELAMDALHHRLKSISLEEFSTVEFDIQEGKSLIFCGGFCSEADLEEKLRLLRKAKGIVGEL